MKLFNFYFYLFNLLLISNQIKASFDHNELNPLKKIKLNDHNFSAQENLFPAETSVLTENDLDSSQKTTETKFEDLNLELLLNISRFMNPKDIGSLSSCSTNLSKTLSYQPNKPGEWLRMKHLFSVKTEDRWYFLEEFLDIEERQDITKINNMNHLVQVNPSKFIKLFLKTLPTQVHETLSKLEFYYQNTIQIDRMIETMPSYSTARENLTALIIERSIWDYSGDAIWELLRNETAKQLFDPSRIQEWTQLHNNLRNLLLEQIEDRKRVDIDNQIWNLINDDDWFRIDDCLENKIWHQLWENGHEHILFYLNNIPIDLAYHHGILENYIKPIIDYMFAVYQMGTFVIRHSEEYKSNFKQIMNVLVKNYSDEDAQQILNKITIPNSTDQSNLLVRTQLDMVKYYLKSSRH